MVKRKPDLTEQQSAAPQPTDEQPGSEAPEIDVNKMRAAMQTASPLRNAIAGNHFAKGLFGDTQASLSDSFEALGNRCEAVKGGDLGSLEETLVSQAGTLDLLFTNLAAKASKCDQREQVDFFLRHALKAQSQCVSTIRAIGELKNPKQVAFVRQANIAHGPQQVNNSGAQAESTRTSSELGTQSPQQLEHSNGEWLDTGTASEAGRGNQTLEAVGAVDRTDNERR